MSLLRKSISTIGKSAERLPVATSSSFLGGLAESAGGGSGRASQLGAKSNAVWLFSTVNRIAEAVSTLEWKLMQRNRDGSIGEIEGGHPASDLWEMPNPDQTREEFIEVCENHFELTGEMFWNMVRPESNIPVPPQELWPVRPDRLTAVVNENGMLGGWMHRLGKDKTPVPKEDIAMTKIPHPLNPFRGQGPIESLLFDIATERDAARWTANFFANSAQPGGIIEYDTNLTDEKFQELVQRWREQHQGVGNAHRVAVIERGKWVDRKFTMSEMQFTELRQLNRDIILGAYGMPKSVLGITDDVNLANAQAGEAVFARWLVVPRAIRMKATLNRKVLPAFDSTGTMFFTFVDPTPENVEQNVAKAEKSFKVGIATRNEARQMINLAATEDGGDDFFKAPAPMNPFGGTPEGDVPKALPAPPTRALPEGRRVAKGDESDLWPTDTQGDFRAIASGWETRLTAEVESLVDYLDQFKGVSINFNKARDVQRWRSETKIEPGDVDGFDWDWWTRYGDEVVEELTRAFSNAIMAAQPDLPVGEAQRLAGNWANERGAQLIRIDGDTNLVKATRDRVNVLVSRTVEEGQSLGQLQKALREDFAFSKQRAVRIARTETATALGQGSKQAAINQGQNEKQWVTQGDDLVSQDICAPNASQGWIKVKDPFQSGNDTIPGHIQCRCNVRYRTAELADDDIDPTEGLADDVADAIRGNGFFGARLALPEPWDNPDAGPAMPGEPLRPDQVGSIVMLIAEARCPSCMKLTNRDVALGSNQFCNRCSSTYVVA